VVVVVVVLDDPSVLATVPREEGEAAGEPQAPRRRHKPKVTRAPRVIRVGNAALYGKGPGMARKLAAPRGRPVAGEYGAMTDDFAITLSQGLPETVLPAPPEDWTRELAEVSEAPGPARLEAVKAVAARHPRQLEAWALLAELADDEVTSYAYARVGYHRGLDALRAAGWRGSGYVRWRHETNRGFLRSLEALRRAAAAIGEADEEERCALFLHQLDPERRGHTSS